MAHDPINVSITLPYEVAETVANASRTVAKTPQPPRDTHPTLTKLGTALTTLATIAALLYGWHFSRDSPITAEYGWGYYLGIVGGSLMLLLLIYPMRKRAKFMRNWGAVKWWFRTHVIFGLLGPVLVLYHSNFNLGSLNSSVALTCMLAVAVSGVIGRFIYTRVHFGLHSQRASLSALRHETSRLRKQLDLYLKLIPPLRENLQKLEQTALAKPKNIAHSVLRLFTLSFGTLTQRMSMRSQLRRGLAIVARHQRWDVRQRRTHFRRGQAFLKAYMKLILKIGHLSFYERLFSLWHFLHFPLFIMLIVTGIIHVIAVHAY